MTAAERGVQIWSLAAAASSARRTTRYTAVGRAIGVPHFGLAYLLETIQILSQAIDSWPWDPSARTAWDVRLLFPVRHENVYTSVRPASLGHQGNGRPRQVLSAGRGWQVFFDLNRNGVLTPPCRLPRPTRAIRHSGRPVSGAQTVSIRK
jgi:hypothetical protein